MQAQHSHSFPTDWHRADIIAALRKSGTPLAVLSRSHGYSSTTLQNALNSKWPKGERIIAEALGLEPAEIWPSRYTQPTYR
jgi:Ner family transcriptional regulator